MYWQRFIEAGLGCCSSPCLTCLGVGSVLWGDSSSTWSSGDGLDRAGDLWGGRPFQTCFSGSVAQ